MRRILPFVIGAAVLALIPLPTAMAAPLTVTAPVNISIPTPFAPGCGGPTEGSFPGANFNFPDSETGPWLAVSPTNANDVAAFWQQDRWSDGGAHGLRGGREPQRRRLLGVLVAPLQQLRGRDCGQWWELRPIFRPVGLVGA